MNKVLILCFIIVLLGCKKEKVLIPDFIDGVPDARFAGTWYAGDKSNKYDYYSFSSVSNIATRHYSSISGSGSTLMVYQFYWRKSEEGSGFEYKFKSANDDIIDYSKEGDEWDDLELTWVNETTIKMGDSIYSK